MKRYALSKGKLCISIWPRRKKLNSLRRRHYLPYRIKRKVARSAYKTCRSEPSYPYSAQRQRGHIILFLRLILTFFITTGPSNTSIRLYYIGLAHTYIRPSGRDCHCSSRLYHCHLYCHSADTLKNTVAFSSRVCLIRQCYISPVVTLRPFFLHGRSSRRSFSSLP